MQLTAYNQFVKNLWRTYYFLSKKDIAKNLDFLKKSEHWPKEKIQAYRNDKLRKIINYAYQNCPYYTDIFKKRNLTPDDIHAPEDLVKLPILTKKDVIKNQKKLLARSFKGKRMDIATGGSTGEPMKMINSQEGLSWAMAATLRGKSWGSYHWGDKNICIWGAIYDHSAYQTPIVKIRSLIDRTTFLSNKVENKEEFEKYINIIQKKKPKFIISYAYSAYLLASYAINNNISDIKLEAVFTRAETLFPHMRKDIEKAFNCQVFDGYASRETALEAAECDKHEGYHISEETTVVEFIKEDGKVAAAGEMGKIIQTDLTNYAMPMIRYQIEDIGIPTDKACSCGRNLALMKSVEGRVSNFVTLPDGRVIHPITFEYLFYPNPNMEWFTGKEEEIKGIKRHQVVQHATDHVEAKIVKENGYNDDYFSYVKKNFQDYLGKDVKITVSFLDEIPASKISGKRQEVVSKIKANL